MEIFASMDDTDELGVHCGTGEGEMDDTDQLGVHCAIEVKVK
jgi:hypothetical protein